MIQVQEPSTRVPRKATAVEAMILTLAVIAIGGTVVVVNHDRKAALRANCSSNLRQIGLGLEQYSAATYYGDLPSCTSTHPPSPEMMRLPCDCGQGIVGGADVFICPSAPRRDTDEGAIRCDYIIFPQMKKVWPSNAILAADKPGNHPDGACMLYKDVHVKYERYPGGDVKLYEKWARAFEQGDTEAALLGPAEWAREQGYLPTEPMP